LRKPPNYAADGYEDEWEGMEFFLKLNILQKLVNTSSRVSIRPLKLEKAKGDLNVIYALFREEILLTTRGYEIVYRFLSE
jgi:hypothetical protein